MAHPASEEGGQGRTAALADFLGADTQGSWCFAVVFVNPLGASGWQKSHQQHALEHQDCAERCDAFASETPCSTSVDAVKDCVLASYTSLICLDAISIFVCLLHTILD
eukprot:4193689-Amphidinium_carterae.1